MELSEETGKKISKNVLKLSYKIFCKLEKVAKKEGKEPVKHAVSRCALCWRLGKGRTTRGNGRTTSPVERGLWRPYEPSGRSTGYGDERLSTGTG